MARKGNPKLNSTAVRIGTAIGRADRSARKIGKNVQTAREEMRHELVELTMTADRLARELKKANRRFRRAFR
jgi:hypothetical protein